jgi:hypothetical protein
LKNNKRIKCIRIIHARETLVRFARAISRNFSEYLRYPTREEAQNISSRMSRSGFTGCIGSLDCMTLEWKNCPSGWAGYYKGRGKKPSIVLEAVVDDQLYYWHAFFGMPGYNNDINVLDSSTLRSAWVAGQYPPQFEFVVNRVIHSLPYLLVDGIYPRYRTFISTVNQPGSHKKIILLSSGGTSKGRGTIIWGAPSTMGIS